MARRVMTWRIEFAPGAAKELDKLDPPVSRRILAFLNERVGRLDDPLMLGEALKGSRLGELWKYRVGDYRVICALDDGVLKILVVRVGNRREVYR
jgi:mRNA interferase RelE/StbE